MPRSEPARYRGRCRWVVLAGLALVTPTLFTVFDYSPVPVSFSTSTAEALARGHPPGYDGPGAKADGAVPAGATVFDDEYPAVANLGADLLGALRRAAPDAAADGVEIFVNSGWRSPAYQEHLLHEATGKYGSKEAARWVATPATSAHVSGDAIDIGPAEAESWLSRQGADYGLCQIYENEPWHYELRPDAVAHGCPAMYTDPTHDPRMQK